MEHQYMKIIGYIAAAILIFFGVLFIWSAFTGNNPQAISRIVKGVITVGVGFGIIILIKRNEPKPNQKIEITQKIDLTGGAKADQMKCQQCGAPLSKDMVAVREGAVFINCPYCTSTYQITEQPKW
jgi:hypothetical protein